MERGLLEVDHRGEDFGGEVYWLYGIRLQGTSRATPTPPPLTNPSSSDENTGGILFADMCSVMADRYARMALNTKYRCGYCRGEQVTSLQVSQYL